jgi:hypothetical protein
MILLQIPPTPPPPPPPGLPIDAGVMILMIIGMFYGLLQLLNKATKSPLEVCTICSSKVFNRKKTFLTKLIPVRIKKYAFEKCKNLFTVFFLLKNTKKNLRL